MMTVSFIIPVYNCRSHLIHCVDSILRAKLESSEILLVDDGSTDGSGALCDALAREHPQVRAIHQENRGASAARNRGLREAAGEKVLFIDADDTVDAQGLGALLRAERCRESDLTVFGMTFDYYRKGFRYRQDTMYHPYDGILNSIMWGAAFAELFDKNALSPLWNKVFRRDILIRNRLELNEGMFLYEDFEFVLRYLRHCGSIWNVPAPIYHYRQSEDEGNAKRRLARIGSIPSFLKPIEAALQELSAANPGVTGEQTARVLQQLYLVLAREKIAVSSWTETGQICREFSLWAGEHSLPLAPSAFQTRLLRKQVFLLLAEDRKTALRHWIAVRVKAYLHQKRGN